MWRTLLQNWPMKLLALGLAVLVWMYANSVVIKKEKIEASFDVVHPKTVSVTMHPESRTVTLYVSGPSAAIDDLPRRRIQIVYTIPDTDALRGDYTNKVPLDEKMVRNLPARVQVDRFDPPDFEVTVRPLATMHFPVNPPQTVGKPAAGYEVGRREIIGTASVRVTGPAEVLKKMKESFKGVDPEPVHVTNRSASFIDADQRIHTTIQLDNTTTEQIRCDDLVEVYVEIRRAHATHVVKGVPISVLAGPDLAREVEITSDNPIDLSVEGPPEVVGALTAEDFHAFIDVRKRTPDSDLPFFENLIVHGLPEGVKLSKDVPVTAKFKLPEKTTP